MFELKKLFEQRVRFIQVRKLLKLKIFSGNTNKFLFLIEKRGGKQTISSIWTEVSSDEY